MTAAHESLYTRCTEVLGTAPDDVSFLRLREELLPETAIISKLKNVDYYAFNGAGIRLVYSKRRECFIVAEFFVDGPGVRQGQIRSYSHRLLSGVAAEDSISDVERKIQLVAERTDYPDESVVGYDFPDCRVTFYFDGQGQQMRGVMVKLKRVAKTTNAT